MKKSFYLIAVVGFIFASCTKREPNVEPTYSFSIGAEKETGSTDETRVEMIDGLMHWSVGDGVGMFIRNAGSSTNSPMDNYRVAIPMRGLHSEPVRATTFTGELTQTEISRINPNNLYDYMTFYDGEAPGLATKSLLMNISTTLLATYRVPHIFTTPKNEFNPDNVLMTATAFNTTPITWLENGTQQFGDRIRFTYKHVLTYLRVKIAENISGKTINEIEVKTIHTSDADVIDYALSGEFNFIINKRSNSISYNGSTTDDQLDSIKANCSDGGGLNTDDYIYIPMPPRTFSITNGVAGLMFRFLFDDNSTQYKVVNLTTNGDKTLDAGKIYDIGFRL